MKAMVAKRLFLTGLVVTCLFALGHLAGFLQSARAARHDPRMSGLTRAMREHKTRLFGFQPSILDFREYFSLSFSILLLLAAALGFVALAVAPAESAAIRRLSVVYVVAMLLLLGTSAYFSVFQGVVSCLILVLLFGLAWWLA
jgi:hypothetical protein